MRNDCLETGISSSSTAYTDYGTTCSVFIMYFVSVTYALYLLYGL